MALFRARFNSFLAGFAIASGVSLTLLQRDLWASHRVLTHQAEGYIASIEARLEKLEKLALSPPSEASESPSSAQEEPQSEESSS